MWSDEQEDLIHLILEDMMNYAIEQGIMEDDTITTKDLFDTKDNGVNYSDAFTGKEEFRRHYSEVLSLQRDYYYKFSQDTELHQKGQNRKG